MLSLAANRPAPENLIIYRDPRVRSCRREDCTRLVLRRHDSSAKQRMRATLARFDNAGKGLGGFRMCDSAPVTLSALAALDSSVTAFGRQLAAVEAR